MDENLIRNIVEEVLGKLSPEQVAKVASQASGAPSFTASSRRKGVFATADEAVSAAAKAFDQLREHGFEGRARIIDIVKKICTDKAVEWGKVEFDETQIGRLPHKIEKLQSIANVPGTEWIRPYGMSGDHGISMEENTPFGIVGAITPVTHSIPTLSCNVVNMVAAGNTIVFNAHPGGARCAAMAVDVFNTAIEAELGIANVITIVEQPTLESFNEICANPQISLLCVTGGPGVVNAAMKSGKRAICAGPGNPPVVVDETARLDKAARDIILGGAYDNNLLCIGEKQVFVVEKVYDQFLREFERAGAVKLNGSQLNALTKEAFTDSKDAGGCSHPVLNRDLVGADASVLARIAGTSVADKTEMLYAETDADHLFVIEEQMMPLIPIIKVKDVFEGIEKARVSEHGYKHSAMMHSLNIEHLTAMAQALDATVFVKNGPSVAGVGNGGEGYSSFSIATTTGEGITTPMTFTRKRRCVMVDNLRIF